MHSSPLSLRPLASAFVCSMLAAFSPIASAQVTTATTDPVGFITLNVAGTGGAGTTALSFKGLGLTRPVDYQGSAETVGTNTLTDNEATWTDNQFNGGAGAYYAEVTSGPGAGTTYDISATAAANKTITLVQNLATGVANGVTFRIRKHWTIGSIFGANDESGLQGGTATTADQIRIYNGTGYDTYFYSTDAAVGTGWRKADGSSTNQVDAVVYPEDGLLVSRQQASPVNVILMGAVKTGQSSFPILAGLNIISNPYAAPMTLGSSNLYTGNPATGVVAGSASTADEVRLYNGSTYETYYYSGGGIFGTGWRKNGAGAADQAGVQVPVGASILITRKAASNFDWVSPQHPTQI